MESAPEQITGRMQLQILGAVPHVSWRLGANGDGPAQVIEALTTTATDVVVGHSFPQRYNSPAGPGTDLATGAGLNPITSCLFCKEMGSGNHNRFPFLCLQICGKRVDRFLTAFTYYAALPTWGL